MLPSLDMQNSGGHKRRQNQKQPRQMPKVTNLPPSGDLDGGVNNILNSPGKQSQPAQSSKALITQMNGAV